MIISCEPIQHSNCSQEGAQDRQYWQAMNSKSISYFLSLVRMTWKNSKCSQTTDLSTKTFEPSRRLNSSTRKVLINDDGKPRVNAGAFVTECPCQGWHKSWSFQPWHQFLPSDSGDCSLRVQHPIHLCKPNIWHAKLNKRWTIYAITMPTKH